MSLSDSLILLGQLALVVVGVVGLMILAFCGLSLALVVSERFTDWIKSR